MVPDTDGQDERETQAQLMPCSVEYYETRSQWSQLCTDDTGFTATQSFTALTRNPGDAACRAQLHQDQSHFETLWLCQKCLQWRYDGTISQVHKCPKPNRGNETQVTAYQNDLHVLFKLSLLSMSSICLGRNILAALNQNVSYQLWHFCCYKWPQSLEALHQSFS